MHSHASNSRYLFVLGFVAILSFSLSCSAEETSERIIGRLGDTGIAAAVQTQSGKWGIAVRDAGLASMSQDTPVVLEIYESDEDRQRLLAGYDSIEISDQGLRGQANVRVSDSVRVIVHDTWSVDGNVLVLKRNVTVHGDSPNAFMSAVLFTSAAKTARSDLDYFAPGIMYGSCENLTTSAIGGCDTFTSGNSQVWIREDRMPAPLFGIRFRDGTSLAILDEAPDGTTTLQDAHDLDAAATIVDERLRFGAMGAEFDANHLLCGYWFPGTEGEVTYKGNTYPRGQMHKWRRRYHPLKDGLVQNYSLLFRFGSEPTLPAFYADAWRWAWKTLDPAVVPLEIDVARQCLAQMLAEETETVDGRTLITNYVTCTPKDPYLRAGKAVFGFTGKNLETAYYLLHNSYVPGNPDAATQRKLGRAIIDTFTTLEMNPPIGEGFVIATGEPVRALQHSQRADSTVVYLRSFGDGMKVATRAYLLEKENGNDRKDWLNWLVSFADWLLTKQTPEGGFPRTYVPGTGEVKDASPNCTYEAVPFLVLLTEATGDPKYHEAALHAAEFAWNNGHADGVFVGGTIDNPNVIDKEAGTLSLEAYVTLYEATRDPKWLDRAKVAANFSETWIYIWNVPMCDEDDDEKLHWKKGVPTVGLQLIATGHSLVDAYMAFDADEYAKLYQWTGDPHYYDVAAILLHNTKTMLALPDRPYDLNGPGWQQEHWSLAPLRGYGLHRGWLPWVSCSQLNGIFGIMDFDRALFEKLAAAKKP